MNVIINRNIQLLFLKKLSRNKSNQINGRSKGSFKLRKFGLISNSNQNKSAAVNPVSNSYNKVNIIDRQTRNCCTSNGDTCSSGFHKDCEHSVNEQILAELNAAYAYLSMACYFGRAEVALPGCHGFFIKMHEEEMGHAHKLIRYLNMRGGCVKLYPITCTNCSEWCIKKAFEVALEMEKLIKEKLICVNNMGEKHKDLNLMDFIVTEYIAEQERSINELIRLVTRYKSMAGCGGCSCSDYLFDKHIHSSFVKKVDNVDIYELEQKYK